MAVTGSKEGFDLCIGSVSALAHHLDREGTQRLKLRRWQWRLIA
jgi:hypothetical protein